MIEFSQTPIDKSQLPICMINHNIVRLHISVCDTLGVAVVQCFQDFIHVVSDVKVSEALIQSPEVNVASIYVLHNESGGLSHRISYYVNQVYNVDASPQSLEDLDLSSDLSLLNYNLGVRKAL